MTYRIDLVVGLLILSSVIVYGDSALDAKAEAFEKALKAIPSKIAVSPDPYRRPTLTVNVLETLRLRKASEEEIESVASQLTASHPSDAVERTSREYIQALEQQKAERVRKFSEQADGILDHARKTIVHAEKPADLDSLLAQLEELGNSPQTGYDPSLQGLQQKIGAIRQFARAWQEYLSAAINGKTEEARNALNQLLSNTQSDALHIFPRSELLRRRDGSGTQPSKAPDGTPGDPGKMVDAILSKVKKVDDVSVALNAIGKIPKEPWNFSTINALDKLRDDVIAGLPVNLDLKSVKNGPVWGDDISRIVAMELLSILPSYFGTQKSDPPKADETLVDYFDRLMDRANDVGDLALLQRVLSVKASLAGTSDTSTSSSFPSVTPLGHFLGGLSQEATGQYRSAVVSYQKSMTEFDPLIPVKIVGKRLDAIKAAHPDDYEQGMTDMRTPPVDPRFQPYRGIGNPYQPPRVEAILPIPQSISIPGQSPSSSPSSGR